MSSIGTGYDLSASQFSPDGRVFQVEYALKATENSGTAIGICGKDGVVFAVEKLSPNKLHETTANKRLFNVDFHIGACIAGFIPDGETLVRSAMSECASHRDVFGEAIQLKRLTDRLAQLMHCYTLYSSVRPLGVSVMFSSWSKEEGPQLFMMDPAGICYGYYGCAIGKGKQNAKTEIEKLKMKTMTIQELIKEAARIIFLVHDEVKDKSFELNLSWVGKSTGGKHMNVPPEVYQDAVAFAKAAMEESDESEEDL